MKEIFLIKGFFTVIVAVATLVIIKTDVKLQASVIKNKLLHLMNSKEIECSIHTSFPKTRALRRKCPYSEFFWSVFSRIQYLSVFSPNAGKYGPEKLQIRIHFRQWRSKHCCIV